MKYLYSTIASTVLLCAVVFSGAATAQEAHGNDQHSVAGTAATDANLSEGEVEKIDTAAAKITIKHGPLRNLAMPGMTMAFKVKDTAMLDAVKVGDKVHFVAEKVNGSLTLTQLETSQ